MNPAAENGSVASVLRRTSWLRCCRTCRVGRIVLALPPCCSLLPPARRARTDRFATPPFNIVLLHQVNPPRRPARPLAGLARRVCSTQVYLFRYLSGGSYCVTQPSRMKPLADQVGNQVVSEVTSEVGNCQQPTGNHRNKSLRFITLLI